MVTGLGQAEDLVSSELTVQGDEWPLQTQLSLPDFSLSLSKQHQKASNMHATLTTKSSPPVITLLEDHQRIRFGYSNYDSETIQMEVTTKTQSWCKCTANSDYWIVTESWITAAPWLLNRFWIPNGHWKGLCSYEESVLYARMNSGKASEPSRVKQVVVQGWSVPIQSHRIERVSVSLQRSQWSTERARKRDLLTPNYHWRAFALALSLGRIALKRCKNMGRYSYV